MHPHPTSFKVSIAIALITGLMVGPAASSVTAQTLPEEAYISGITHYAQSYNLSCESRSAADWANYFGAFATETQILEALPRSDNPEVGFVGDPNGPWGNIPPYSYGVHAAPVAGVLQELGLPAEARRGMSFEELQLEIASGRPVIAWITGQMWAGVPEEYTTADGEMVIVARFEHTMIVVGYNPSAVHVLDAYTGLYQVYDRGAFDASWSVLGNQAVVYAGEVNTEPETEAPPAGDTYIVRAGDYLSGVARALGLDWLELARWNGLTYPYTLYPEQELVIGEPSIIPEIPPEPVPVETPEPEIQPEPVPPPAHIVQTGDILVDLARQYNLTWQELTAANGLVYPYFIYPGQILALPVESQ